MNEKLLTRVNLIFLTFLTCSLEPLRVFYGIIYYYVYGIIA